ncbi:MAG: serine/threonine protein kinase [Anaerolineaceae bacterium]|nr:serine/threonine protein kinase [Anaerolineaceae bacterium]
MATRVDSSLGKYKLIELLGKGGMAEVYKAYQEKLDRYITIKILHNYLADGEDFLARFEREAIAVAALRHPHIVQIHDFDLEDDTYYMVMEFIDGGTLTEKMAQMRKTNTYLPLATVRRILQQIASALDYAHQQGIIHRDIKPSNILLNSNSDAFLTDFGIAHMISGTQFTATGSLIGTPTYMAPEQGLGLPLSTISDIYSLGVVLYEMLAGKAPFVSDTPLAIIHKHINEPIPKMITYRLDISDQLEQVVEKALQKDPADRYQSAAKLFEDFDRALTPELIDQLESTQQIQQPLKEIQAPVSAAERNSEDHTEAPTEIMGAETIAEISGKPIQQVPPEPLPIAETPAHAVQTRRSSEHTDPDIERLISQEFSSPTILDKIKQNRLTLSIVGLLIIIVVTILAVNQSLSNQNKLACESVEDCMRLTFEYTDKGEHDTAFQAFDKAAEMVPQNEHQVYAWIWCDRAAILDSIENFEEAQVSRDICGAWERGE